jgi:CubicO group peptidase (beta-lactamase class C family)
MEASVGAVSAIETRLQHLTKDSGVVQAYVSVAGTPLIVYSAGTPMLENTVTNDTVFMWSCTSKLIVAVVVLLLASEGVLSLDETLPELIPNVPSDKTRVTLLQLLTHEAGVRTPRHLLPMLEPGEQLLKQVLDNPIPPGWHLQRRCWYDRFAGPAVLAHVVAVRTGQSLHEIARERVFLPVGAENCWFGIPKDRLQTYRSEDRIGVSLESRDGRLIPNQFRSSDSFLAGGVPGVGCAGPMQELGKVLEALAGFGDEGSLATQVGSQIGRQARPKLLDEGLGIEAAMGHGVMVGLADYGFGQCVSKAAWGHNGLLGTWAMVDPIPKLVIALQVGAVPPDHRLSSKSNPSLRNPTIEWIYNQLVNGDQTCHGGVPLG